MRTKLHPKWTTDEAVSVQLRPIVNSQAEQPVMSGKETRKLSIVRISKSQLTLVRP